MPGRTPDRRIAWAAFGLAAAAFATVAASSHAPAPPVTVNDPEAARALYHTMRAGEQVDAIIEYAVTRRVTGQPGEFTGSTTEAKWGGVTLTRSADTLFIETPEHTYNCDRFGETPECIEGAPDRALPRSDVFAVAVATGAYGVTRAPGETIAGEPTKCFRIRAVAPPTVLPGIGDETTACFARDGLELRTERVGPNTTEGRAAVGVRRAVDRAALGPVLAGFEKVVPKLSR